MSAPRSILAFSVEAESLGPALESLEKQGAAVKCVGEIYRFVAAFATERPDVAIVDTEGFRKQDLEVFRVLRDLRAEAGIVALVDPAQREIASGAFCQGADFYLLKPVACQELLEAVGRTALRRKAAESPAGDAARAEVLAKFAAGLAEKINTPLTVLSGWLQLLSRDYVSNAALADKFHVMQEETERIAATTRQLLAIATQGPPRNDRVDVARLLAEMDRLYAPRCREKGAQMMRDVPDELPRVQGDEGQLRQAFDMILQHNVAALGARCKLEIISRPKENGVEVAFRDNGPPIPPERLQGLFDPFAPTRLSDSRGLDLAVAHVLIRNHGGRIEARSDASPLTEFVIWLPCWR